ncbi:hypothetical protein D5R38_18665 [Serratia marcescens]|uniref:hypothetical protein n=1 Tax=Serratia marcescens TaxID=615 RepID=UPI001068C08B|nr:hypothetical protein [Serratia marcescens]TEW83394.1 hypothetical protein D5R38_18665 [Serratia marcescens]
MSVVKLIPNDWIYDFDVSKSQIRLFLWIPELEKLMQARITKFEINAMFDCDMIKCVDNQRVMMKIWNELTMKKEFKYHSIMIRKKV